MLSLSDLSRASVTTRFTNASTSKESTVSSHSYMCTLIARRLVDKVLPSSTPEERLDLVEYCLIHDVEEVVTCDLQGPFKHFLCDRVPALKDVLDDVSKALNPDSLNFQSKYESTPLLVLAKLADKYEDYHWFSRYGHADQEYETVLFQINQSIEQQRGAFSFQLLIGGSQAPP